MSKKPQNWIYDEAFLGAESLSMIELTKAFKAEGSTVLDSQS